MSFVVLLRNAGYRMKTEGDAKISMGEMVVLHVRAVFFVPRYCVSL